MACGREYRRRAGEDELLHEVVRTGLAELREEAEAHGGLPRHLLAEARDFLKCGVLAHGFVRVRCSGCGEEALVAFSCKGRGLCPSCGARRAHETAAHLVDEVLPHVPWRQWTVSFPFALRWRLVKVQGLLEAVLRDVTRLVFARQRRAARRAGVEGRLLVGAVTQVQYFGSALQLSPHFHALVPDGVFVERAGAVDFVAVPAPTPAEVARVVTRLAGRVAKALRRRGLEDEDVSVEDGLDALRVASLQQHLPLDEARHLAAVAPQAHHRRVATAGGISMHADTWCHAHDRDSLERLCRSGARPALAASRLSRREDGRLEYRLKRPVAGRQVLVLTPLQLLRKLAAVCPPKGKHLVHFHGVFAPNAKHRSHVVAWGRPPRAEVSPSPQQELPLAEARLPPRRPRLDWASLLRRTFALDVLSCPSCGARRNVLAAVTRHDDIQQALSSRGLRASLSPTTPRSTGPPAQTVLPLAFAA